MWRASASRRCCWRWNDHFKRVNDTHGHAAGDLVIQAWVDALRDSVRPMDLVARVGGEEFAIVMPNCPPAFGEAVAERAPARRGDAGGGGAAPADPGQRRHRRRFCAAVGALVAGTVDRARRRAAVPRQGPGQLRAWSRRRCRRSAPRRRRCCSACRSTRTWNRTAA
ncbi:MAG: GGDEF domain-containing protein [Rubrivivax sp.]